MLYDNNGCEIWWNRVLFLSLQSGYCDFFLMPDLKRYPMIAHSYIMELKWKRKLNVKTAIQNVDKFSKNYFARKEITIRFSATRRPLITDTADTYNGIDILTLIRSYFLSLNGINAFAAANYAQYRATDIQTQSFSNDDENIQLMPYFDCDYIYTDDFADTINKIDDVQEKDMEGV